MSGPLVITPFRYSLLGGVSFDPSEEFGSNVIFQGHNNVNTMLRSAISGQFTASNSQTATTDNTDFNFGSGSFTLLAWINPDSVSANQTVFSKWQGTTNRAILYRLKSTGELEFRASSDGAAFSVAITTSVVSVGSDFLLCGVVDMANDKIKVSINGETFIEAAFVGDLFDSTEDFAVGSNAGANFIDAQAAPFTVYDKAITQAQLNTFYNGGAGLELSQIDQVDIKAHWIFQEPGAIKFDSINDYDLTDATSILPVLGKIIGSNAIDTWNDQGENANDIDQSELTNRLDWNPLTNRLDADGIQDEMDILALWASIQASGTGVIAFRTKIDYPLSSEHIYIDYGIAGGAQRFTIKKDTSGKASLFIRDNSVDLLDVSGGVITDSQEHNIIINKKSSSLEIYIDGVSVSLSFATGDGTIWADDIANTVNLGSLAKNIVADTYSKISYKRMLFLDVEATADQITGINSWLTRSGNTSSINLWAASCSHLIDSIDQISYNSIEVPLSDLDTLEFNYNVGVITGDFAAQQEPMTLSDTDEGEALSTALNSSSVKDVADLYSLSGNHDAGEANFDWFNRYIDIKGDNTSFSGVNSANRPHPITFKDGTDSRAYYITIGNLLIFMISDRNDVEDPWGKDGEEQGTGGYPSGTMDLDQWNWLKSNILANKNKNIVVCTHMNPRDTTIGTPDGDGVDGNFHGSTGIPDGSGSLYSIYDEDLGTADDATDQILDFFNDNSDHSVVLWMAGHTHTRVGETFNGRGHRYVIHGVNFLNIASLTKTWVNPVHGDIDSRSWIIEINGREMILKNYVHNVQTGGISLGFQAALEFKLELPFNISL